MKPFAQKLHTDMHFRLSNHVLILCMTFALAVNNKNVTNTKYPPTGDTDTAEVEFRDENGHKTPCQESELCPRQRFVGTFYKIINNGTKIIEFEDSGTIFSERPHHKIGDADSSVHLGS